MASGLAVLACLGAAAPATAHEFTASRGKTPLSPAEPAPLKGASPGEGERNQAFKFAGIEILCAAHAKAKTAEEGALTSNSSATLAMAVTFQKCLLKGGTPSSRYGIPVRVSAGEGRAIKFVYHANGAVVLGLNEGSATEVGAGTIKFKISNKVCTIGWENQVLPARAEKNLEAEYPPLAMFSGTEKVVTGPTAKFFEGGIQHGLKIENVFKGIKFAASEGQCLGEAGFEEEWKRTEGTGSYTGSLEVTAKDSNLGWQ